MQMVTEIVPADKKGKQKVRLDNGEELLLYRSEIKQFHLKEGESVSEEDYSRLIHEVLTRRAKRRTMHLLERMDRTEYQLREKLRMGGYPLECIDAAIAYVKDFHYLDDRRYAGMFVRLQMEKMSRRQIRTKLLQKGIKSELIEEALDEEYQSDETEQIANLLKKRHYSPGEADEKEFRRTYQYLLRRGFQSSDILKQMNGIA